MNPDDPIFRSWLDATNAFLAGAGLPPLKAAAPQVNDITRKSETVPESHVTEPASAAAPLGDGVMGAAVTPIDRDTALYQTLRKIWTQVGKSVFKQGTYFCYCENEENAWYIADRLNAFDANLEERNMFQRMYLHSKEEPD